MERGGGAGVDVVLVDPAGEVDPAVSIPQTPAIAAPARARPGRWLAGPAASASRMRRPETKVTKPRQPSMKSQPPRTIVSASDLYQARIWLPVACEAGPLLLRRMSPTTQRATVSGPTRAQRRFSEGFIVLCSFRGEG